MAEDGPAKRRRDFVLKAEPGHYTLAGGDARLTHRTIQSAVKASWLWIGIWAVVTLFGIVFSYYTSGWISVTLSSVVAVVTLAVGYFMLQKEITITNETR
jgi:hypothetical protein